MEDQVSGAQGSGETPAFREELLAAPEGERAALLEALWQLDPTREETRKTAAALYRRLYEQAPSVRHRDAYARLTGVTLPPGPPLPPLPDELQEDMGDVDALLRQVDKVSMQLGAA